VHVRKSTCLIVLFICFVGQVRNRVACAHLLDPRHFCGMVRLEGAMVDFAETLAAQRAYYRPKNEVRYKALYMAYTSTSIRFSLVETTLN
jgi:hypothetical protein